MKVIGSLVVRDMATRGFCGKHAVKQEGLYSLHHAADHGWDPLGTTSVVMRYGHEGSVV